MASNLASDGTTRLQAGLGASRGVRLLSQLQRLWSQGFALEAHSQAAIMGERGQAERVTPAQYEVLRYVDQHGRPAMGEVSSALGLTNAAITKAVRGLIEGRSTPLLERVADADKRVVRLATTAAGQALASTVRERLERAIDTVLARMEPAAKADFERGVDAFLAAALPVAADGRVACLLCGAEHLEDCAVARAGCLAEVS